MDSPTVVRLLALPPVPNSPKLPVAVVGARLSSKPPVTGVQLGVNGKDPDWALPVTTTCAEEELTKVNKAAISRLTTIFHWWFILGFLGFIIISSVAAVWLFVFGLAGGWVV